MDSAADLRTGNKQEWISRGREMRDGNENRADVTTLRNAEEAKEEEEENLLEGVKVMEVSDLEKCRKPTRALCKYRKEDGIRFLLAGKKQIGTSP